MQPRRSSTMGYSPIHVMVRQQSDATAQALWVIVQFMSRFGKRVSHRSSTMGYSLIHVTVQLKRLLCLIHTCDVTVQQQSDATAQALWVTVRFMSRFGNRVSRRSSTMGYSPIHATSEPPLKHYGIQSDSFHGSA
ncbi:hypothetical protein SDJN03_14589, partial [Cucurbita argyrosperma subsp. sororia]